LRTNSTAQSSKSFSSHRSCAILHTGQLLYAADQALSERFELATLLRWALSKLRRTIGAQYLLADRPEIAFNFESDYWLDVTAFEAGQLDLYRGDFLEGLRVRDAYHFKD
jgi:hypothetical protein